MHPGSRCFTASSPEGTTVMKMWTLIQRCLSDASKAEDLDLRGGFRRAFRIDPDAALAAFELARG